MHEMSIALSIIDFATDEAERRGSRVTAVHLRLGPLSGVVKDALLFSYDVATADTPLAGSLLVIDEVPIVVYCPVCREPRTLESMQLLACPACGSPTPEVREGRELEVVALEIES
jgi:hydrogenase nickel incorporation protein HypA/HybF